MSIGSQIKKRREELKISQKKLAELVGMSQQSLSEIENGGGVRQKNILKFAKHLQCSEAWLQYGKISTQGELINKEPLRRIPLLSWNEAKQGPQAVTDNTEVVLVSDNTLSSKSFALEIDEDSMSPRYPIGCRVVIDPEIEPKHKSRVLVDIGPNRTPVIREYLLDGPNITLNAFNPSYSKFTLTDDMSILGVVAWALHKEF